MKKLFLIPILFGCKKPQPVLIDAIKDGAKLTKADAGYYVGTWWSEQSKDSLVINLDCIKNDSVYYISSFPEYAVLLTHSVNFKPKDDNLFLDGKIWRLEH